MVSLVSIDNFYCWCFHIIVETSSIIFNLCLKFFANTKVFELERLGSWHLINQNRSFGTFIPSISKFLLVFLKKFKKSPIVLSISPSWDYTSWTWWKGMVLTKNKVSQLNSVNRCSQGKFSQFIIFKFCSNFCIWRLTSEWSIKICKN